MDNINDEQIEKLAQRVAKLVINNLHEGLITGLNEWDPDEEEELLAELAKCMTLLDKYLKAEDYEKCDFLQNKIKTIEQKLRNL
jgi:CO dehydrogenase nickel-insertion accessory protein CooC1